MGAARAALALLLPALALGALTGCAGAGWGAAARAGHPNLLVILADDLGWGDISHHGSEIATPHIDRIFREGVELERFYTSPMCTPTRAALLTGRSPVHFGLAFSVLMTWSPQGLPAGELTLAERFRQAGYQTAAIGKWHLGHARPEHLPNAQGFDRFFGMLGGWIGYYSHREPSQETLDWQRDGVPLIERGYATRLLGDEALRFLAERDGRRPFFLYFAPNAPHAPVEPPDEAEGSYQSIKDPVRRDFAGLVDALDAQVGRLLDALDRERIAERTVVVFLSDNGGAPHLGGRNEPLRGEKSTTYEGGIRVPAAVRWPGRLEAGRRSRQVARDSDLFATLAAAAGLSPLGAPAESMNLWPVLQGAPELDREPFFFRVEWKQAIFRAVLDGRWKLVTSEPMGFPEARHAALYDLSVDPGERASLADREPARVAELERRLSAWERLYPEDGLRFSTAPPGWRAPEDLSRLAASSRDQ
jgi:arylsulfatase A-like enzyme